MGAPGSEAKRGVESVHTSVTGWENAIRVELTRHGAGRESSDPDSSLPATRKGCTAITNESIPYIPFPYRFHFREAKMSTKAAPPPGVNTQSPFEHVLFPRAAIHRDAGLLTQFLTDLTFDDLPSAVVHTAKVIVLDTIGCIAAGADTPLGRDIVAAYNTGNVESGCCVPGTSLRIAPATAAKVNGWLSDVLDYEDVAVGHPSATVVPAALAMAQHLNASPTQFLLGVVAGYEAGLRVHDATRASQEAYRRFAVYIAWHGLAAGAAAMAVAGGSEEQFRSALGHAAANTCLPLWYVQYGRPAHALKSNYGQMALGGVDAALCARQNIVGPFAMLSDPERGFARIIGSDQFDPSHLSADLTRRWRTSETSLKAFPCGAALHTTIDAIAQIVHTHHVEHHDIEQLQIRCFSRIPEWFSDDAPATAIDAQLSVQYVSAMSVLSIEPGRHWYSPSTMADPRVAELMKKIVIEVDPVAEQAFWNNDQYMSSVTIVTRDGRTLDSTVEWAPWNWHRPFNDSDVAKKFLSNVRGTPLEKYSMEIVDRTMNIDQSASLAELLGLLSTTEAN